MVITVPPGLMRRKIKLQIPKKMRMGTTHDSSVVSQVLS
jgi:hypothetical protein